MTVPSSLAAWREPLLQGEDTRGLAAGSDPEVPLSPASQQSRHATLRAVQPRKVYELWRDTDGNYAFFPRENGSAREGVGPTAELVWSVEAASWDEAVAAQRQYLGWGG